MSYNEVSFEKRLKENIKNYAIKNLYVMDMLAEYLQVLADVYGMELLLTDRHGETALAIGDFEGFEPDVVNKPGEKIRVADRTVGHMYVKYDKVQDDKKEAAGKMLEESMKLLTALANEVYMHRESASYIDELESKLGQGNAQRKCGETEDILTGVYNKNYIKTRMQALEDSETVPVAVINVNINDWKFVYDNFGVEKSDSLIQVVASIVKKEAGAEYIIGRIDGDVFLVLIPLAEDGEAEDYCRRVQAACQAYDEDEVLAPSVATGIVYRTNVEESLEEKMSDAEYEMFNNKLEIKNSPGYQERLRRGLKG